MEPYCKSFTNDIFKKYDTDNSNVLERRELKIWIREELKSHAYMNKPVVQR